VRSCLIDGEAVACDGNSLAVFERLRRKISGKHVFLFAFDLLELNGQDLRREPIETRKATLAILLREACPVYNTISTSRILATPCSSTPAPWARSVSARATSRAARRTRSSSRTRTRRQ
jgi:ATP-dependent DNA ligase